jgi:hypothetical protein
MTTDTLDKAVMILGTLLMVVLFIGAAAGWQL